MKTEWLAWTGKKEVEIFYTEEEALKFATRAKAAVIEKCMVTRGGLIVDSEVIWRRPKI